MENKGMKGTLNWLAVGLLALLFAFAAQPVAAQVITKKQSSINSIKKASKSLRVKKKAWRLNHGSKKKKGRPSRKCPGRTLSPKDGAVETEAVEGVQAEGEQGVQAEGEQEIAPLIRDFDHATEAEPAEGGDARMTCGGSNTTQNLLPRPEKNPEEQTAIEEFSGDAPEIGEAGPVDTEIQEGT